MGSEGNNSSEDRLEPYISSDLPEYIIKNLTPLKRREKRLRRNSDESNKPLERKKGYLEKKKSKLHERSNLILQRVRDVELSRQVFSKSLKENLHRNLELANERRKAIIEGRRRNARRYSGLLVYSNYPTLEKPFDNSSTETKRSEDSAMHAEEDTSAIDSSKDTGRVFLKDVDAPQPANKGDSNFFADSSFTTSLSIATGPSPFSESDLSKILILQRTFKRRSLSSRATDLRLSNLLHIISRRSFDNLKKILSPEKPSYKRIARVLELMSLPGSYRVFMYAFVLLAETKDSIREGSHPGYNSNLASSEASDSESGLEEVLNDMISNTVSILLYKSAFALVRAFVTLIHETDKNSFLNPYGVERLKFSRLWRQYYFYFNVFKPNHLERTLVTSTLALRALDLEISVITAKMKAGNSTDEDAKLLQTVKLQKNRLKAQKAKLDRLTTSTTECFMGSFHTDWISLKEVTSENFRGKITSIIQKDSNMTTLKTGKIQERDAFRLISSQLSLEELNHTRFSKKANTLRYPSAHVIRINNRTYFFPPFLAINQWRRYIVLKLIKKKPSPSEQYGIPKTLRAGLMSKIKHKDAVVQPESDLHVENVFKTLGLETIFERVSGFILEMDKRSDKDNISILDDFLSNSFLNIFEYCIQFHGLLSSNSYETITSSLTQVRSFKNLFNLSRQSNEKSVISFFELHFKTLLNLSEVCPPTLAFLSTRCSDFLNLFSLLVDDMQLTNDHMIDIALFYQGTDIIIHNMWLKKCFQSVENMPVTFEVGLCMAASHSGFRTYHINRATNSPHLRFPKFYEFMSNFDSDFGTNIASNLNSLYKASFSFPTLESSSNDMKSSLTLHREKAYDYFYGTMVRLFLSELHIAPSRMMIKSLGENELTVLFIPEMRSLMVQTRSVLFTASILAIIESIYSRVPTPSGLKMNSFIDGTGSKLYDYLASEIQKNVVAFDAEQIFNIIKSNILCNLIDTENVCSIDLHEAFLVKYIGKEINSPSSKIVSTLTSKLSKILSSNAIPNELLKGNFGRLQKETIALKHSMEEFFGDFYRTYKPVLEWIYDDIGTPSARI